MPSRLARGEFAAKIDGAQASVPVALASRASISRRLVRRGDSDGFVAVSPLTPALSPLRGEGVAVGVAGVREVVAALIGIENP